MIRAISFAFFYPGRFAIIRKPFPAEGPREGRLSAQLTEIPATGHWQSGSGEKTRSDENPLAGPYAARFLADRAFARCRGGGGNRNRAAARHDANSEAWLCGHPRWI